MVDALLWLLSAALIVAGLAGTVLPALPGTVLVFGGIVLGAWIDGFTRVGWGVVASCAVLALLAWVLDYVAGLLGARKAGASRQALIGAALGTVAGVFTGLVGVLFMPLVGAAFGEFLAQRDHGPAGPPQGRVPEGAARRLPIERAVRVGVSTWLGIMAGLVSKVVLAFMMIGLFVAALLL
jgi:uncharacterized protein YqgC (DUF456 family)